MVSGYDLRMNLSYFIGKSYEKEIMNKINEVSQKYTCLLYTSDAADEDNLTSKLKDFAKRYDGKVNFSIRISSTDYQQINDVAWYQILSEKDYEKFKDELPYSGRWFYKFNSINKDNLLKGINNFESLLRYISEPKIIKKQKRNDE